MNKHRASTSPDVSSRQNMGDWLQILVFHLTDSITGVARLEASTHDASYEWHELEMVGSIADPLFALPIFEDLSMGNVNGKPSSRSLAQM